MKTNLHIDWVAIAVGVFIILSISFRWKFLINNYKVQRIYKLLGNKGGTAFYLFIGLIFILIGLLDVLNVF